MNSLKELREYAKNVDENIAFLENEFLDTYKLTNRTERSVRVATATMRGIQDGLDQMSDELKCQIENEKSELEDLKSQTSNLHTFIADVRTSISEMEKTLVEMGIMEMASTFEVDAASTPNAQNFTLPTGNSTPNVQTTDNDESQVDNEF